MKIDDFVQIHDSTDYYAMRKILAEKGLWDHYPGITGFSSNGCAYYSHISGLDYEADVVMGMDEEEQEGLWVFFQNEELNEDWIFIQAGGPDDPMIGKIISLLGFNREEFSVKNYLKEYLRPEIDRHNLIEKRVEFKCQTCGVEIDHEGICNNCWEVEQRLWQYLQSEKARERVRDLLAEMEK